MVEAWNNSRLRKGGGGRLTREGRGRCTLSANAATLSELCSTAHKLHRNVSQLCWLQ